MNDLEQYGDFMVDPISGLSIPKRPDLNIQWRRNLIVSADKSDRTRGQLLSASAKSAIFWLNAFGWTYRPKKVNEVGKEIALTGTATHVPFITWKIQDEAILQLIASIEGGFDAAIDKARDMGATWLVLSLFVWFWRFRASTTFLVLSRKEGLVDRRGSMDSLFEKMRYLLKWMPNWMQPTSVRDTYMHLENRDNGSVIDGESSSPDAGQASRSTATLLDEFARVPDGEAIDVATADTSACRIFNSTPGSPTSHFTRIIRAKRLKIIPLPWWRHPEKGKGLHLVEGSTVKGIGATLPIPADKLGYKWVSPWYQIENERRSSRNVAQNLDMQHGRVGDMIFDIEAIEKHRASFAREPDMVGTLKFDIDLSDKSKLDILRKLYRGENRGGYRSLFFSNFGGTLPWKLWTTLVDFEYTENGEKFTVQRPPQDDRYVFGIDISAGTGSSNSIITVKSHSTGRIVAKFVDASTPPEALAEMTAFAAVWFGGRKLPYVVFEKNGPGLQFGKRLIDVFKYPSVYFQTEDGKKGRIRTKRWGWHSSNQRKELLIGNYREALFSGKIINPSDEALDEAADYTFDDAGRVAAGSSQDEESGAGSTHGDHVIADALTVLGSDDLPLEIPAEKFRIPHGTHASRLANARRHTSERKAWE